jgi:hypothetical protein
LGEINIGALCWNQCAAWPDLLEAGRRADRLGYDTLWTWVQEQVAFCVSHEA